MRKFVFILSFIILPKMIHAQSDSFKSAFMDTYEIIQKCISSSDTDVIRDFYDNNSLLKNIKYSTMRINFRIEDGFFIFYMNEHASEFNSPRYYQSGVYILRIPFNDANFDLNSNYDLPHIRVTCNNGMTLSHRGKTKNISEYKMHGEKSSLNLLYNSLLSLQHELKKENFLGTLSPYSSPSPDFKEAYNRVIKTLTDYKFRSEDTWYYGDTKSIALKLQGGFFVFTFRDTGISYDSRHSFGRDGIKTIKIPIFSATFYQPYNEEVLNLCCGEDKVEIIWRGQKEIIKKYEIKGTELTIKKLQQELEQLLTIAIEENFRGTLDVINSRPKTNATKAKTTPQKKEKSISQPQQRQRKRVPFGN